MDKRELSISDILKAVRDQPLSINVRKLAQIVFDCTLITH